MSRPLRIYIVFGGFGGLSAWLLVGVLPDFSANDLFGEILTGCAAGLLSGALLGTVDGARGQQWRRMVVGTAIGGARWVS